MRNEQKISAQRNFELNIGGGNFFGKLCGGGKKVKHAGTFTEKNFLSPDGREGFQNIFLRKNFSVYLIDQPRIGEAGLSTEAVGNGNV